MNYFISCNVLIVLFSPYGCQRINIIIIIKKGFPIPMSMLGRQMGVETILYLISAGDVSCPEH